MRYLKLGALLLVVLLLSCKGNDLNPTNPNATTVNNFWKDAGDAKKALNTVYGATSLDGVFGRWIPCVQNIRDDLTRSDSPWGVLQGLSDFSYSRNTAAVSFVWRNVYHGIYRANQVIANVPDIDMDGQQKKMIMAQARFLRAVMYFQLVKIFKNIPLIKKPVKVSDIRQSQAKPQKVYDFIISELKSAQGVLPDSYSSDKGRATWGAATGFLGKAYLFDKKYSKADAEFKKIIDSHNYSLVNNYAWNFDTKHEHNNESIYEINYSNTGGGAVLRPGDQGEAVNLTPTAEWKNTQLRPMTFAAEGYGWADVYPSKALYNDYMSEKTKNGNLDPRMFTTLIFNNPKVDVYGKSYAQVYGQNSNDIYWAKYQFNNQNLSGEPEGSDVNNRVMRYADVLLMYAETRNELGDQATAAKYIQMVRDRANMPDHEAQFAAMTKDQLKMQISHERVVELAGEGHRFDDLRRWGWLNDQQKLNMLKNRNPDFNGFVKSRAIMPIPQNEIETNPAIDQNPGY